MNKADISNINELLKFLPKFRNTDKFIEGSINGKKNKEGIIVISMPSYIEEVRNFFRLVGNKFWTDYDYSQNISEDQLLADDFIKQATFEQIKSLLTFINRSEHFCDGCWNEYLKNGKIVLILKRLEIIANSN